VWLDVPPALADLAEDGGVAADDDDAGHQEAEQHQELLRGLVVFPARSGHNGTAHFKNVNNCLKTNIYSYFETSGANVIKLFLSVIYGFSY
jgi:hypothetical protein